MCVNALFCGMDVALNYVPIWKLFSITPQECMVDEDCGDLRYCLYEMESSMCLPCTPTDMVGVQSEAFSFVFLFQTYIHLRWQTYNSSKVTQITSVPPTPWLTFIGDASLKKLHFLPPDEY